MNPQRIICKHEAELGDQADLARIADGEPDEILDVDSAMDIVLGPANDREDKAERRRRRKIGYNGCAQGRIPHFRRSNKRISFSKAALLRYIKSGLGA